MFHLSENHENKAARHSHMLKKLELELERCSHQSDSLLATIGLSMAEIEEVIDDTRFFTHQQRAHCQEFLAELTAKHNHHIVDQRKKSETYAILRKAQSWIHVR